MFLLVVVSLPLLIPGLSPGVDWLFHIVRVESIKEGLLAHEFPVKIHSLPINGYGYGNGLFYPQVFLYIPALLRVIGLNIDLSNKIFIFMLFCARFYTSYYAAKYISKNKFCSVCVTMMLLLSPLALYKVYMLLSYGDIIGQVFSPLVMCGLYNLIYEDFDKPHLIGIGFLGLVYSHIISSVMMAMAVVFIICFNLKSVIFDLKKIKKLLLVVTCDVLLSAFIWVPLVEQMITGRFFVSYPWSNFEEQSKLFKMCIYFLSPYLPIWFILLAIVVIVTLVTFFLRKFIKLVKEKAPKSREKKFVLDLTFSNVIFLILVTDVFPWRFFKNLFGFMQFTSRFFYIIDIFFCFCIPIGIYLSFGKSINKVKTFFRIFLILLVADVGLFMCLFERPQVVSDQFIQTQTEVNEETICFDRGRVFTYDVGWGKEYVPADTDITLLTEKDIVISDKMFRINSVRNGNSLEFLPVGICSKYFDVPRFYYKGYKAVGIDENDNIENLTITKGYNGLVRVNSDGHSYKKIKVWYEGTMMFRVSELISLGTFMTLLILFILKKQKNIFFKFII